MLRRLIPTALALFIAAPLAAQAPTGLMMRVYRSTNANDPDDVPDVQIATVEDGFYVTTGPAAVLWRPEQAVTGDYTLGGRFTLMAAASHRTFYGVVFGGRNLEGAQQTYHYFMVAQTGEFVIIHRADDTTTTHLQTGTAHPSVRVANASGRSVNDLEVRVGGTQIEFVVNGTIVHTAAKTGVLANTDGIWGVRINHVLPGGVLVRNLGVSAMD